MLYTAPSHPRGRGDATASAMGAMGNSWVSHLCPASRVLATPRAHTGARRPPNKDGALRPELFPDRARTQGMQKVLRVSGP